MVGTAAAKYGKLARPFGGQVGVGYLPDPCPHGACRPMKILWVKMGGLWPMTTGGRVRSLRTIAELAKQRFGTSPTLSYGSVGPRRE